MKTNSIIIILFIAIFGLTSCYNFPLRCITGNGNVIQQYRNHDSFSQVISEGSFDVFIDYDSVFEIIIEGEENLLPYIETEVRNSKLYIEQRENRCFNTNHSIIIRITLPELTGVNLAGSGNIICDRVETEYLKIDLIGSGEIRANVLADYIEANLIGSGDIEIDGQAYQTDLSIPGSGNIKALGLSQQECEAEIAGSGNIYVTVSDYLDVRILGSGNLYYQGDPELSIQIIGSGNVISLNE